MAGGDSVKRCKTCKYWPWLENLGYGGLRVCNLRIYDYFNYTGGSTRCDAYDRAWWRIWQVLFDILISLVKSN